MTPRPKRAGLHLAGPMAAHGLALLVSAFAWAERASAQAPFDRPLEIRSEKLTPDPQNPEAKRQVSCFYYQHLVVKQVDLGEVGADRLSFLPRAEGEQPACGDGKEAEEHEIPSEGWSGYFKGLKDDYLFFDAADGVNGGLGFVTFQASSRKKVFQDIAEDRLAAVSINDGRLILRYRRTYAAPCSVVAEGAPCIERVIKETGLTAVSPTMCTEGYRSAKQAMARARCDAQGGQDESCLAQQLKLLDEQKWDAAPSVLAYDVEASPPAGQSAQPDIRPLGEAQLCRPAD
jgi:hypothetical protein